MTELYHCPLCSDTYDAKTDLRLHLEVKHRKSEIVSYLVERDDDRTESALENEAPVEEERSASSA